MMTKNRFLTSVSCVFAICTFVPPTTHAEVQWLDRVVAVAGQQVITQIELDKEQQLIERQLRARETKLPTGVALDRQVMERLIVKKLQLQAAQRVGVRIDDETLERAVSKIAGDNGMSVTEFRRALTEEGIGFTDFRNSIRDELTISSLRERQINKRVNVTDQEIDDLIEANVGEDANKEYLLSHILISVPGAASPDDVETAKTEANQIRQRAAEGGSFSALAIEHSDGQKALEGGELGWRKATQLPSIFVSVVKKLDPGEISQPIRSPSGFHLVKLDEIRGESSGPTTTESLSRHILIKSEDGQKLLKKLRTQILQGKDFAELAREYSEDPGSGREGGNLGWNFPGTFVPAFEETLSNLEVGEISQPFRSRFGWHIIELMEQRNASVPKKVLRERARQVLTQQKQEEELQLWLRRLRDEAFVEYRLPGMDPAS